MITKEQLTQLKRQIIASALLGVLMSSIFLSGQVYKTEFPALIPKINSLIKTDKDESAGALYGVFGSGLPIVTVNESISAIATTAQQISPKRSFIKESTKACLSARIFPALNLLLNRTQFLSFQFSYNSGYIVSLGGSSRHLFQPLEQQNPESNACRAPPASQA